MPRANRGTRLSDRINSSGHFEIVWTENGRSKRVSTGTGNRRSAEKVLAGYILEREKMAAEKAGTCVSALVAAYEENHIKPRAVDTERALNAGKPIVAFFGSMSPQDINDEVLVRYQRQRGDVSPATVRRELQHLNAALNHAVRNRRLSIADKPHITLPSRVEPRSRVLDEGEVQKILTTYVLEREPFGGKEKDRLSRVHRFVQLMLRAPARPAAITGLTWFQVDLKRRLIDYRQAGATRTKKRRTAVPISNDLLPILLRAHAERTNEFVLDHDGKIRKAFETLVRECGFPDVTPYTLRHTYGSAAIARGVPPALVAEVMGDTIETVMRNYKHLMPDHLRDAVEGVWGAAKAGA